DRGFLAGGDATGRLVRKEKARLQRVGDRHVEELALALRDAAGQSRRLFLQPELAKDLESLLPDDVMAVRERPEVAGQSFAGKDGERHVVQHRQLVEEIDDLEAPRDPGLDSAGDGLVGDILAPE